MRRWFMDTEFDENGETIKLISIALVGEGGEFYYACCLDGWRPEDCNEWVRDNVVSRLPPRTASCWKTREQIRVDLRHVLLPDNDSRPELWGYFSDYDWVVFCQLWGKMFDLPNGMPMFCLDLKQQLHERGISNEDLPKQDPDSEHDALADARWVRKAWLHINRGGSNV